MKKLLTLAIFLLSITVLYCVVFVISPTGNIEDLGIVFDEQKINWQYNETDGNWYLFLPADAQTGDATIHFSASLPVKAGGERISTGDNAAFLNEKSELTLQCGKDSYDLKIMRCSDIPSVFINTASGSLKTIYENKNNKEPAELAVFKNGHLEFSDLKYIKGRGNSTWWVPEQKPYNIYFSNKTDFLGLGEANKFTLLTMFNYDSQLTNDTVYRMASELGIPYTTSTCFLNLFVNGDFQGLYLAAEGVEVGKNCVDIHDIEADNIASNPDIKFGKLKLIDKYNFKYHNFPFDPPNISGGYLLEVDDIIRYKTNDRPAFLTMHNTPVNIKAPEHVSYSELWYISDFFNRFEEAIMSEDGFNSQGEHYSDLIDIESMAKMYILQEYTMNIDGGSMSFYYVKDQDNNRLVMAPAWDFDSSFGTYDLIRDGIELSNPNIWFARYGAHSNLNNGYSLNVFYYATCHDEFNQLVNAMWEEMSPTIARYPSFVRQSASLIRESMVADDIVQNGITGDFERSVERLCEFAEKRMNALDKGFNEHSVLGVIYISDPNPCHTFQYDILEEGDVAIIRDCYIDETNASNYSFKHWEDVDGTIYYPGSSITVSKNTVTLHAVFN